MWINQTLTTGSVVRILIKRKGFGGIEGYRGSGASRFIKDIDYNGVSKLKE